MPDDATATTTTTTTAPDYSQNTVPLPTDGTATEAMLVAAINGLKTAVQGDTLTDAQKSALERVTDFFA